MPNQSIQPAVTIHPKDSLYGVQHPESGLYFSLCRRIVTLRARGQATLFLNKELAAEIACRRLHGVPFEIVRFDA